jgi:hypothetical protein
MPEFYQNYLRSQLELRQYLLLTILINLLQSLKTVKLETLAAALPLPILFESRRHKLQKFLSVLGAKVEQLWLPLFTSWLKANCPDYQVLYLAIDRTSWRSINLLMVSLIWEKRAIPIYFDLLTHKGSTSFELQTEALTLVLPLVKDYTVVLLGDREFCGVKLANWLAQQGCYFCLRLKQNEYIELELESWIQLKALGLKPGISLYLEGVRLTKQKGFKPYNLAAKWKKKYRGWAPDEGWFIFTNLESLDIATQAYKKRFGIEEMFRDLKSGGYNLEETSLSGARLKAIILLITLAYTSATFGGKTIKNMGIQKYVGRVQEVGRTVKRHSSFYIGLYGQTWVHCQDGCEDAVVQLMKMTRNKWSHFQRGLRARTLIMSTFQLSS